MARWQPAEREARYAKARRAGRPVVVSEGDSWFDYPLYRNIIDRVDDLKRFAIKRLEFSGDTVANMIGKGANWRGLYSLKTVVERERPRFVLFSGGGNDIVGKEIAGAIRKYNAQRSAAWHLDTEMWQHLTGNIEQGYQQLLREIGPLAPVFAHGYDYIIPANKPVRYDGIAISGPWVLPEMENMGIPPEMQVLVGREMIDWFNRMLAQLEREHSETGYFAHIDLRNTLLPAQWQNEIHPTRQGFEVIAARFVEQLDSKLINVLSVHDAATMELL